MSHNKAIRKDVHNYMDYLTEQERFKVKEMKNWEQIFLITLLNHIPLIET